MYTSTLTIKQLLDNESSSVTLETKANPQGYHGNHKTLSVGLVRPTSGESIAQYTVWSNRWDRDT